MALDSSPDLMLGWSAESVLPPNATRADRVRERGLRLPERAWLAAARVGAVMDELPDEALPFLLYELGLEPVADYLPDLRTALTAGRAWQRIRGTPAAIDRALGWIGVAAALEEDMAGTWWDLFQLGLGEAVPETRTLEAIVALARLSKPAHTDLIRISNAAWDTRPVVWDGGLTWDGGAVDDWSGRWMAAGKPKVSLGRVSGSLITAAVAVEIAGGARIALYDPSGLDGLAVLAAPLLSASRLRTRAETMLARPHPVGWLDAPWTTQPYEAVGVSMGRARVVTRGEVVATIVHEGTLGAHLQTFRAWSAGPWSAGPWIN